MSETTQTTRPVPVTLLFDVRSPWCYQTSRWLRRLAALGEIALDFGVFSLEVVNLHDDEDPGGYDAEYGPALRVALALRDDQGPQAVGDFYAAFGTRMWETPAPDGAALPDVPELTRQALADLGIDPAYADKVLADEGTWTAVLDEHRRWAERRVFGVPTLLIGTSEQVTGERVTGTGERVTGAGERVTGADERVTGAGERSEPGGQAEHIVFGPVLRTLPSDEDAVALWRHLHGLAALGTVFELKRFKSLQSRADLPNAVPRADLRVADMRAARALMGADGPYADASLEWTMGRVRAQRAAAVPREEA